MSFRNRLGLFFVLIVIVPMLAVAFLLFRLIEESTKGQADAAIAQRHTFASTLFREQRRIAEQAVKDVGQDRVFTSALQDGDIDRARRRAEQLLDSRAIERIVFVRDGESVVRVGDKRAIAPAVVPVVSSTGRDLGVLGVSVIDARQYVDRVNRLAGLRAVVVNGNRVLASGLPGVDVADLPSGSGATYEVRDTDYRVQNFVDPAPFDGQMIRVFTLGDAASLKESTSGDRLFAGIILLGFLLLAIACAVLVSRTLQQQIASFLAAARRLAGGDFSAKVPTVGHDEFAALGEEFNKMSSELERRLAELTQERARVQSSMRLLGEAVGRNLDRDALLEIVLQTAVDGVGADAGRVRMRTNGDTQMQERARGDMNSLEAVIESVEAEVMRSGSAREVTIGAATAIANPLRVADRRDEAVGVISVARAGRSFTPYERELLTYLAGRLARSMENVDVYETVALKSVTDYLTGLSNRDAFDAGLLREVERVKRFGDDLGLVLIDLDDFGKFNKVYGVLDGDAVLREVGRVLRDGSREIDLAARYGGEELAVVLPGTDLEGAYNRAERIREQIEQLSIPRANGGGTLRVTASCGVASARGPAADKTAVVEAASTALNEAKSSGKNATRCAT